jgi:DNA-binding SARP family transcriptional activator
VSGLSIRLLGPFQIVRDSTAIPDEAFSTPKARSLLKILVSHRRRFVSREQLVEWLWPDAPAQADASLRSAVSRLRRVFEPDLSAYAPSRYIRSEPGGYCFDPLPGTWIDVDRFEEDYARGRAYERAGRLDEASSAYELACTLYRGDYLEDDRYADWAVLERERLRELRFTLLSHLADTCAMRGRYAAAIEACREVLRADSSREGDWRRQDTPGFGSGLTRDRALSLRPLDDRREVAFALYTLGYLLGSIGRPEERGAALAALHESLAFYRAAGEDWRAARVLNALGYTHSRFGEHEAARACHTAGLTLARAAGDTRTEAHHLSYLGHVAYVQGQFAEAQRLETESLGLFRALGIEWGVASALQSLGRAELGLGHWAEARAALNEAYALFRRLNLGWGLVLSQADLCHTLLALGDEAGAARYLAGALREALARHNPPLVLEALAAGADWLRADGHLDHAAALAAVVLWHNETGSPPHALAGRLWAELGSQLLPAVLESARVAASEPRQEPSARAQALLAELEARAS